MDNALESVIERAEEANAPEPGDYTDEEGFLVCGRCGTRRECDVEFTLTSGQVVTQRVRTLCECRERAEREKSDQARKRAELERIAYMRRESLMDERLEEATFESFKVTAKNEKNFRLCKSYVERFDAMLAKNQGLLFYGGVGTGKTFAAACIANYLLERSVPVVMTSFVKLLASMIGSDEASVVIQRLNRAKLLIIDDLGAERETGFAVERVYDIIDSRYRAKLPIILTTNLGLDEMKRATDLRYARIYDRIFELCYPVQFAGGSWRKAEATRRFREMGKLLEDEE